MLLNGMLLSPCFVTVQLVPAVSFFAYHAQFLFLGFSTTLILPRPVARGGGGGSGGSIEPPFSITHSHLI